MSEKNNERVEDIEEVEHAKLSPQEFLKGGRRFGTGSDEQLKADTKRKGPGSGTIRKLARDELKRRATKEEVEEVEGVDEIEEVELDELEQEDLDIGDEVDILPEGYKVGDSVNLTNTKATPRHKIVGKTKTHYMIKSPGYDEVRKFPKERIASVNKQAWKMAKDDPEKMKKRISATRSEEFSEASIAADTLKANSKPAADPKSKIEVITAAIGAMHSMKKDDLVKWYNDTMAQFGKFDAGAPAASEKNKASIDAKPSAAHAKGADVKMPMVKINAKEDVEEMFGEELSEEFKERATTLFEAAVSARVMTELARLEEEFETKLVEEIESVSEDLIEALDSYVDYVVENWMKENEVAIESSLRNELMEDFIEGMRNLFAEHYIDVPADKLDVLEALSIKVEALEDKLNEAIDENVEMKREVARRDMEEAIAEASDGLTMVQKEKFAAMSEGIEFDGDVDTFRRKLQIVKENYFSSDRSGAKRAMIQEAEAEGVIAEEVSAASPEMKRYAAAISRTIKK